MGTELTDKYSLGNKPLTSNSASVITGDKPMLGFVQRGDVINDAKVDPGKKPIYFGDSPDSEQISKILEKYAEENIAIIPQGPDNFIEVEITQDAEYRVMGFLANSPQGELWLVKSLRTEAPDPMIIKAIKIYNPNISNDPARVHRMAANEERAYKHVERSKYFPKFYEKCYVRNEKKGEAPFLIANVIEYIQGHSLEKFKVENLSDELRVLILEDLAKGLDLMHRRKLIHRDFKPSNVIIPNSNKDNWFVDYLRKGTERPNAKICDLALASDIDQSKGQIIDFKDEFSEGYVSPDIRMGKSPTVADDYYSYVATAFFTLTGQRPFLDEGIKDGKYLEKNLVDIIPLRPDLPNSVKVELNLLFKQLLVDQEYKNFKSTLEIFNKINSILYSPKRKLHDSLRHAFSV